MGCKDVCAKKGGARRSMKWLFKLTLTGMGERMAEVANGTELCMVLIPAYSAQKIKKV